MPIRYLHVETVRTTPERAFAVIDDLPQTAKWLPPCVSLEKIGSGPNAVGDKLRYVYRQGGRQSEMGAKFWFTLLVSGCTVNTPTMRSRCRSICASPPCPKAR